MSYDLPSMLSEMSAQFSTPLDTRATSCLSSSESHGPLRNPGVRCKCWEWFRPVNVDTSPSMVDYGSLYARLRALSSIRIPRSKEGITQVKSTHVAGPSTSPRPNSAEGPARLEALTPVRSAPYSERAPSKQCDRRVSRSPVECAPILRTTNVRVRAGGTTTSRAHRTRTRTRASGCAWAAG